MGVYLPFYSGAAQMGEDARRELHKFKAPELRDGESAPKAGLVPSSMWKEMDTHQKQMRDKQQQQRPPHSQE